MASNMHGRVVWARYMQVGLLSLGATVLSPNFGASGGAFAAAFAAMVATSFAVMLVTGRKTLS
jgi:hypothetical protein